MKEERLCHVTNCTNIIHTGGYVCTKHIYRFKKYGCYDLPGHEGPPSVCNKPEKPEWAAGQCKRHGWLTAEQMYFSSTAKGKYQTKGCRRCTLGRNIRKNYGFPGHIDDYEKIAAEKDHSCEICGKERLSSTFDKNHKRNLVIDHCHATGKFRGVICHSCNSALGYFKDSISSLERATEYLRRSA